MNRSTDQTHQVYPLGNGSHYTIRPIQADDRDRILKLFDQLSPESRYLRFAHAISKLPDEFLEDILHLDYKTELALLAVTQSASGTEEVIGIARYVTPPNLQECEFSISVSDQYASHGIGTHLMIDLIAHAKRNGLKTMMGYVLSANSKMLKLVSELGFQISNLTDEADFRIVSLAL
jgi:RimJ/RimL family protein N-acetyltransferase